MTYYNLNLLCDIFVAHTTAVTVLPSSNKKWAWTNLEQSWLASVYEASSNGPQWWSIGDESGKLHICDTSFLQHYIVSQQSTAKSEK